MALPAPPDVGSWADTIMRRLSGGNMGLFAGFDPVPYENQLTNAYQSAGQQLAGLDQSEALARANNTLQLGNVQTARDQALRTLREKMAGQGLTDSSINLDETARTNQGYDQQVAGLNAGLSSNLSDIIAKRLGVEGGYQGSLGSIETAMSGAGSGYLQQQAAALAQQKANEALLAQQKREADIAQANMALLAKASMPQIISTPPQQMAPQVPYTPPPVATPAPLPPVAAPPVKPLTGIPPVSNYNPIGRAPQPIRQVPVKTAGGGGGIQIGRGNTAV